MSGRAWGDRRGPFHQPADGVAPPAVRRSTHIVWVEDQALDGVCRDQDRSQLGVVKAGGALADDDDDVRLDVK